MTVCPFLAEELEAERARARAELDALEAAEPVLTDEEWDEEEAKEEEERNSGISSFGVVCCRCLVVVSLTSLVCS